MPAMHTAFPAAAQQVQHCSCLLLFHTYKYGRATFQLLLCHRQPCWLHILKTGTLTVIQTTLPPRKDRNEPPGVRDTSTLLLFQTSLRLRTPRKQTAHIGAKICLKEPHPAFPSSPEEPAAQQQGRAGHLPLTGSMNYEDCSQSPSNPQTQGSTDWAFSGPKSSTASKGCGQNRDCAVRVGVSTGVPGRLPQSSWNIEEREIRAQRLNKPFNLCR